MTGVYGEDVFTASSLRFSNNYLLVERSDGDYHEKED